MRFQYTCNLHASVEHHVRGQASLEACFLCMPACATGYSYCKQPAAPNVAAATRMCGGQSA